MQSGRRRRRPERDGLRQRHCEPARPVVWPGRNVRAAHSCGDTFVRPHCNRAGSAAQKPLLLPGRHVFVAEVGNDRIQKLSSDLGLGDPTAASVYMWGAGRALATASSESLRRLPRSPFRQTRIASSSPTPRTTGYRSSTSVTVPLRPRFRGQVADEPERPQLLTPAGIAVAPTGASMSPDTGHHRVVHFSRAARAEDWGRLARATVSSRVRAVWPVTPTGTSTSPIPTTIACRCSMAPGSTCRGSARWAATWVSSRSRVACRSAPNGIVYVADSGNHRIEAFAPP